jgi:hypothetical protein
MGHPPPFRQQIDGDSGFDSGYPSRHKFLVEVESGIKTMSLFGSNENCFRCGGLGTYAPRSGFSGARIESKKGSLPTVSRQPPNHSSREPTQSKDPSKTKCGRCIFRGSPEQVKTHFDRFHRREFVMPRRYITVPCPKCNLKIRASRLQRHIRRAHSPVSEVHKKPTESGSRRLVLCPECCCKVLESNLLKHLRRVHSVGWAAHVAKSDSPYPAPPSRSSAPSSKPSTVRTTRSEERFATSKRHNEKDDLRDAHRLMGFIARESGRFGSHPLHDRFDDESSA